MHAVTKAALPVASWVPQLPQPRCSARSVQDCWERLPTSDSFLTVLVRRMAGAGVDDPGGDDDAGGGVVDTGGNAAAADGSAAAAEGIDATLPSGRWVAYTNAKAAVHSATAPISAAESHLPAGFAEVACGVPYERPSSHVATT